ncbi:hypothetical protein Tco_0102253 [Tanacetum coccineum]
MPLGNASRTANILEHKTHRCSTVSNTPLSSNSFAARRDNSIHRRLWFGNDQIAPILGYGDLVQGTVKFGNDQIAPILGGILSILHSDIIGEISRNVAFRKCTCYIRDLKGNDLLTGSRGTYLYSISLQDSTTLNLICLMAKATLSQA